MSSKQQLTEEQKKELLRYRRLQKLAQRGDAFLQRPDSFGGASSSQTSPAVATNGMLTSDQTSLETKRATLDEQAEVTYEFSSPVAGLGIATAQLPFSPVTPVTPKVSQFDDDIRDSSMKLAFATPAKFGDSAVSTPLHAYGGSYVHSRPKILYLNTDSSIPDITGKFDPEESVTKAMVSPQQSTTGAATVDPLANENKPLHGSSAYYQSWKIYLEYVLVVSLAILMSILHKWCWPPRQTSTPPAAFSSLCVVSRYHHPISFFITLELMLHLAGLFGALFGGQQAQGGLSRFFEVLRFFVVLKRVFKQFCLFMIIYIVSYLVMERIAISG